MSYTAEQASVLRRLRDTLEAQRPWKRSQFKDLMASLREHGIPEEKIAAAIEVPPFFINGWALGLRIPPHEEWEPIITAVISLIDRELQLVLDL